MLVQCTLDHIYLLNVVKGHCNLIFLDNIEVIGHNDTNIGWSSDEDSD